MKLRHSLRAVSIAIVTVLGMASIPGSVEASALPNTAPLGARFGAQHLAYGSFSPKYVALGDSVSAGLGLAPGQNATPKDLVCGRSPLAYSTKITERVNHTLQMVGMHLKSSSVACQGATMDNLSGTQSIGGDTMKPQLDAAFEGGSPQLLTLTMGANDVRWGQFIGTCLTAGNCNTEENTALAKDYIATVKSKLTSALKDIKQRSNVMPPFVIVTGYYIPLSEQCAIPGLTNSEITWLQEQTMSLNQALRQATQQPGTSWFSRFAPVDFTGHDICAQDAWIQRPGVPGEPAPFHPTLRGQQAIAEAVLNTIGM